MRRRIPEILAWVFGLALILFTCEAAAEPTWHVESAPPRSIQLDQNFGLFSRLYDLYYGDGDWDMTVHEYTASRPGAIRYTSIIDATGNSVTLRIPKKRIIGSMTRAPGDREIIPVLLWYKNKKLTEMFMGDKSVKFPNYREESVEVIFKSSRQIKEPRPALNPLDSGLDDDQILEALASHSSSRRLFSASYTGHKFCGFDVMRMADFQTHNKLLLERQKPPMSYGNLLVSKTGNQITRKIFCEPTVTSPMCHTTDFVFGWVPVKISFDGDALCDIENLVQLVKNWAEAHAVSQTVPTSYQLGR